MALRAVEHTFTGTTASYLAYDSTKTVLGKWIQQKTGSLATDKYAGPFPVSVIRPMEQSTGICIWLPYAIDVGNNVHWVFGSEQSAAAATRRIVAYTYNTATQTWAWKGFITLTYPTATVHTIRGFRVQRHLYTTGTVAVSGTGVTGTSTAWQTARYGVGSRIGFGSTDPNSITTWYYISAIGSDTAITLSGSAGTISAGSAFVIEELRVYTSTSNATAANGGLFVAKGVNIDDFSPGGTTIAAATTTDNLKAVYWLADASTVLNTAAGGLSFSASAATDTSHDMYVINVDAASTLRIYKYNGRAALAGLASGKSTSAFTLRTGQQAVTGTIAQTSSSSKIVSASHGPGSGVACMYVATSTRILRITEASIIDATTTYVADAMTEVPPGGTGTYSTSNLLTQIEYISSIDRFVISGTSAGARPYVTQYQTSGAQFDRIFGSNNSQLDQTTADAGLYPYPSTGALWFSPWVEDGVCYLIRVSQSATANQGYAVPLSCDWDFAGNTIKQRLITPSLTTTGCTGFKRLSVQHAEYLGSAVQGLTPEPFRCYYRTTGISDDSGSWTLISDSGDISGSWNLQSDSIYGRVSNHWSLWRSC
jgi:hypothetical protein